MKKEYKKPMILNSNVDAGLPTVAAVFAAGVALGLVGLLSGMKQGSVCANGIAGIGSVNGGWRDFGLPEIAWPVTAP